LKNNFGCPACERNTRVNKYTDRSASVLLFCNSSAKSTGRDDDELNLQLEDIFVGKLEFVKKQLNFKLLSKDCPTCGETNHLTVVDLVRSFYMRTPYDRLAARHFCHSCHAGWDVKFFSSIWLLWFLSASLLFFVLLMLIVPPGALSSPFVTLPPSTQVLAIGSAIVLLVIFLILDFLVKVFLVKILPLKKQSG
jgi:hypothetical protein